MSSSRLDYALRSDSFAWPQGPLLALRPEPGLSGLPIDRTRVAHGFKPAYDLWAGAGYQVDPYASGEAYSASYLSVPRARGLGRALVVQALSKVRPGGLIVIDGAKTDGVDALIKTCKQHLEVSGILSKSHGKIAWFFRPQTIDEGLLSMGSEQPQPDGWVTAPGVFSADAVDVGSRLLGETMPDLTGRVADLGAGWGYLSAVALCASKRIDTLDLIEAEWAALDAARENVSDPRTAFHWADALRFEAPAYDTVLSNPPFHTSRHADPALGQGFIRHAARLLKPQGVLALVANRHLPYEPVLAECFAEVTKRADAEGFKVIHAHRPRQSAGRKSP